MIDAMFLFRCPPKTRIEKESISDRTANTSFLPYSNVQISITNELTDHRDSFPPCGHARARGCKEKEKHESQKFHYIYILRVQI